MLPLYTHSVTQQVLRVMAPAVCCSARMELLCSFKAAIAWGITWCLLYCTGPTGNGAPAYLHTALGQEVKAQMYTLPRIWKKVAPLYMFLLHLTQACSRCMHKRHNWQ